MLSTLFAHTQSRGVWFLLASIASGTCTLAGATSTHATALGPWEDRGDRIGREGHELHAQAPKSLSKPSQRAAIVWETVYADVSIAAPQHRVRYVQELGTVPDLPFNATAVSAPPTALTLGVGTPAHRGLLILRGYLLAYTDGDADGGLRLLTSSTDQSADRVLGMGRDQIVFIAGTDWASPERLRTLLPEDRNGFVPADGMHLLRDPCSNELRAGLDLSASECKYRRLWHGAASPVPVHPYRVNAKSAEFQESNMMPIEALQCVSAWSCIPPRPSTGGRELRTYPPGEVPARFPPSDAPDLSCAENGRSYVQQSSRVKVSLRPDQFPPTGWPCSIKAPEPPRDSQGSGQPYRAPRMSSKRVGTLASLVP